MSGAWWAKATILGGTVLLAAQGVGPLMFMAPCWFIIAAALVVDGLAEACEVA